MAAQCSSFSMSYNDYQGNVCIDQDYYNVYGTVELTSVSYSSPCSPEVYVKLELRRIDPYSTVIDEVYLGGMHDAWGCDLNEKHGQHSNIKNNTGKEIYIDAVFYRDSSYSTFLARASSPKIVR